MRHHFWLLIAPILLILSCKSGEKLYNKGRYDDAVVLLVKKLQKRPKDAMALDLLPKAYNASQRFHEDRVNGFMVSNNELKWENIRQEYRSLQRLYDAIHGSPAALAIVTPKDYRGAITGAQENAAQVRYDRGVELLEQDNKPSARRAFDEFDACVALIPNFRNAAQLRDEAFQRGVVNVVVRNIDIRSSHYQFSADQFRDVLIRNLQSRNINRFVRFTDERVASRNNLHADQVLEMNFYDFIVGQTYVDRSRKEVSREIEAASTKDSTGKKVVTRYKTVKATLYFVKATVVSEGLLDYRVIDVANNNIIHGDRLPGSYTWVNEFAYYKGDLQALTDQERSQMGGEDIPPPPPQELFMLFTRPIYDRLTSDMQSMYNSL